MIEQKIREDGYIQYSNDRSYTQNEHVRVAEKKLGRKLGKKEIVHHADEDKTNNSPENIIVLRSAGDHTRIHAKIPVEVFQTSDGSCVVVKQQRECPHCLRLFEPDNNRDVHCSLLCYTAEKAKNIPSAEELKQLVWSKPTTQVAKDFNVSDNAIINWCEKYGIAKPPRGFWRLVETGKVCLVP
jgi:hypothetical protein